MISRVVRSAFCAALAAAAFCAAVPVRAQDEDKPPEPPAWAKDYAEAEVRYNEKKYAESIEAYKRVLAADPDNQGAYYNVACCYALLGKTPEAIEWFEKAVGCGYDDLDHVAEDPDFDSIREDPKFKAILEGIKQRDQSKGEGIVVFRAPEGLDPAKPVPLIVALHDWNGNAEDCAGFWGGPAVAAGCVLACPQGSHKVGSTKFAWVEKLIEEQVLKCVERAKAQYPIDAKRVLLTGFSNGGLHTYVLGLRHPEVFSAIAPVAAYYDPLKIEGPLIKAQGCGAYILMGKKDGKALLEDARQARDDLIGAGMQVVYEEFDGKHKWPEKEKREELMTKILDWFVKLERPAAPPPEPGK